MLSENYENTPEMGRKLYSNETFKFSKSKIERISSGRLIYLKFNHELMRLRSSRIIISFVGLLGQLIFLILAIMFYEGPHRFGFMSYMGEIEVNPLVRVLFNTSGFIWGITQIYFWKTLNQILGEEDRIGIILGSLIGFSVIGIIIFPQGATSLLHMIFDYGAFFLNVIVILYYSIKLWLKDIYNKILLILFLFGDLVFFFLVGSIVILWNYGEFPLFTGILQRAGIFSLIFTYFIQHIYIIKKYKKIRFYKTSHNKFTSTKVIDITPEMVGKRR